MPVVFDSLGGMLHTSQRAWWVIASWGMWGWVAQPRSAGQAARGLGCAAGPERRAPLPPCSQPAPASHTAPVLRLAVGQPRWLVGGAGRGGATAGWLAMTGSVAAHAAPVGSAGPCASQPLVALQKLVVWERVESVWRRKAAWSAGESGWRSCLLAAASGLLPPQPPPAASPFPSSPPGAARTAMNWLSRGSGTGMGGEGSPGAAAPFFGAVGSCCCCLEPVRWTTWGKEVRRGGEGWGGVERGGGSLPSKG